MVLKNKNLILLFLFLFFYFCAGDEEGTEKVNNSDNQTSTENVENSNQEVGSSQDKSTSLQEAVYEIIQEFPDGLVSFLSKTERMCLFENASSFAIRQMEIDLMEGRKITEENLGYFKSCNIPPPPEP